VKDVIVVGAGLAGLTAALRLTEAGYRVRVFERYPRPGGLARICDVGGEPLEAFYHHLFTTDTAYLRLAEELGVADRIEWLPSRMGIWAEGRLWDFATPQALLRFGPLSWSDKVRFVISTLRLQHSHRPEPFEDVTAADWIRRHMGDRVWDVVWGPLLQQKFSDMADEVAMVWLWRKVYLRGRSRSASGMGEKLGYMRGSFAGLVEALERRLLDAGVAIDLADPVVSIDRSDSGFEVRTRRGSAAADRVVAAVPVPDYLDIAGHLLPEDHRAGLATLRATGALCTLLELQHSLTPYYWLNIADPDMPFGGLIEHTNYVSASRYAGRPLLYISNYLFTDHPLYRSSRRQVLDAYLPGLQRINPDFDPSWIVAAHHFRADYAQPVVTVGYRHQIPSLKSPVEGLYLCSMAQVYPEDRGQNYAIAWGEKVARAVLADVRSSSDPA
jgi:protoporphyrinogen oxidase